LDGGSAGCDRRKITQRGEIIGCSSQWEAGWAT
jgi:hypothetical protein